MAQFTAQQPAQPTQPSSAFDMSGMMSFMMQQQQQMQQQWQQQQQEFAQQLEQQRYEEEKRRRIEDEQRRQEFERYRKEEEERHRQEEQRRREEEDQRRRDAERPDSRASNSSRSSTFSTASKQEICFENDSRAFGIRDPADFWQLPQVIALVKYCKDWLNLMLLNCIFIILQRGGVSPMKVADDGKQLGHALIFLSEYMDAKVDY